MVCSSQSPRCGRTRAQSGVRGLLGTQCEQAPPSRRLLAASDAACWLQPGDCAIGRPSRLTRCWLRICQSCGAVVGQTVLRSEEVDYSVPTDPTDSDSYGGYTLAQAENRSSPALLCELC